MASNSVQARVSISKRVNKALSELSLRMAQLGKPMSRAELIAASIMDMHARYCRNKVIAENRLIEGM